MTGIIAWCFLVLALLVPGLASAQIEEEIYPLTYIDIDRSTPGHLHLDGTMGTSIIPLVDAPRYFQNDDAFWEHMVEEYNGAYIHDIGTGAIVGVELTVSAIGTFILPPEPLLDDPERWVIYFIRDPFPFLLGGRTGQIQIGDEVICVNMALCHALLLVDQMDTSTHPDGYVTGTLRDIAFRLPSIPGSLVRAGRMYTATTMDPNHTKYWESQTDSLKLNGGTGTLRSHTCGMDCPDHPEEKNSSYSLSGSGTMKLYRGTEVQVTGHWRKATTGVPHADTSGLSGGEIASISKVSFILSTNYDPLFYYTGAWGDHVAVRPKSCLAWDRDCSAEEDQAQCIEDRKCPASSWMHHEDVKATTDTCLDATRCP